MSYDGVLQPWYPAHKHPHLILQSTKRSNRYELLIHLNCGTNRILQYPSYGSHTIWNVPRKVNGWTNYSENVFAIIYLNEFYLTLTKSKYTR